MNIGINNPFGGGDDGWDGWDDIEKGVKVLTQTLKNLSRIGKG